MTQPAPNRGSAMRGLEQESASGERRCARGRRCADAEVDTDSNRRRGALLPASGTLCSQCQVRLTRALNQLPRDYVQLETILDHQLQTLEHVSGTPDLPTPTRLDVLTLQADIDTHLTCWAEPVAEALGITWDTQRMAAHRPGPRIVRAAHLLACNVPLLLKLEPTEVVGWIGGPVILTRTGLDAALELLALHERAQFYVNGDSGDTKLPAPCPRCEGTLIRRNGADQVECQHCPGVWAEADYRHLCRVLAQDLRGAA